MKKYILSSLVCLNILSTVVVAQDTGVVESTEVVSAEPVDESTVTENVEVEVPVAEEVDVEAELDSVIEKADGSLAEGVSESASSEVSNSESVVSESKSSEGEKKSVKESSSSASSKPKVDESVDAPVNVFSGAEGTSLPAFSGFSRNITTEQFINEIKKDVIDVANKNDLFPSVILAQAILESGGGTSGLSAPPHNNLFGIKGTFRGSSVSMSTGEEDSAGNAYTIVAGFRTYPTVKDSIQDYADLIKDGVNGDNTFYKGVWRSVAKTPENAASALQGKYATDTRYADKLNNLIKVYNLKQYDKR